MKNNLTIEIAVSSARAGRVPNTNAVNKDYAVIHRSVREWYRNKYSDRNLDRMLVLFKIHTKQIKPNNPNESHLGAEVRRDRFNFNSTKIHPT